MIINRIYGITDEGCLMNLLLYYFVFLFFYYGNICVNYCLGRSYSYYPQWMYEDLETIQYHTNLCGNYKKITHKLEEKKTVKEFYDDYQHNCLWEMKKIPTCKFSPLIIYKACLVGKKLHNLHEEVKQHLFMSEPCDNTLHNILHFAGIKHEGSDILVLDVQNLGKRCIKSFYIRDIVDMKINDIVKKQ